MNAVYFDGYSAKAYSVSIAVIDGYLVLDGDFVFSVPLAVVRWGEALGAAPRRIEFGNGAYCEIANPADFNALMTAANCTVSWVDRMQRSWRLAVSALLLAIFLGFSGMKWGVPAAAGMIAYWVPESAVVNLSSEALQRLDQTILRASSLPETDQVRLTEQFSSMSNGHGELLFRSGDIGPNAFALPDGRVILLDDLVRLAASEDEVLAVLAHELGHVRERHGLRALIQGSVVAGLAGAVLGDISALLAAAPAVLLQARYSRDLEREADAHAAAALIASGRSPHALADILERMQKVSGHDASALLSTHPATHERISSLRERAGPGSAP